MLCEHSRILVALVGVVIVASVTNFEAETFPSSRNFMDAANDNSAAVFCRRIFSVFLRLLTSELSTNVFDGRPGIII